MAVPENLFRAMLQRAFRQLFAKLLVLTKLNELLTEGFEIPERKDISLDSMLDLICRSRARSAQRDDTTSHGFHDRKCEAFARAAKQDKISCPADGSGTLAPEKVDVVP